MSNPYAATDTIVVDQLREFTDLTAVVGTDRIRFLERRVDTREVKAVGDNGVAIWVTTGLSPEQAFTSTHSHETELVYEITILHGGKRKSDLRQLQWHIRRAYLNFSNLEDASGNSLSSSNPLPMKWSTAAPSLTEFTNTDDGNTLQSTATLRVPLIGDPTEIKDDTASTPLPTQAYFFASAAQLHILFDRKIAQAGHIAGTDYDLTDWTVCLTGVNTPSSPSLTRLLSTASASGTNNVASFLATATTNCGTDVKSIAYSGTHLVGDNGVTVAAFTLTDDQITIVP